VLKRYAHAWDQWAWVVVGIVFATAFFAHGSWAIALLLIAWMLIVAALIPLPTMRWAGVTICAAIAVAALVYGVIDLTEGSLRPGGSYLGWAGLFSVFTWPFSV
jgi:hypothetical protein